MWSSIWKWIKRILFIITMLMSIMVSMMLFSETEGGLNIFLEVLTIIFAIGSCVLYFIFNEYKKWPIVLALIALFIISICLKFSSGNDLCLVHIFFAFIGLFISTGFKKLFPYLDHKSAEYQGFKAKALKIASRLGIIAGIVFVIYTLYTSFFNK